VDHAVLAAIAAHRTEWATTVATAVMWVGTTPAALAAGALAALAVTLLTRAYVPALAAVASVAVAAVSSALLKDLFARPRPPASLALVEVGGYSFPSTQAAETAALAAALLVTLAWSRVAVGRAVAAGLVAAVLLVGVCMVYLGAHWLTDVVAGWVLGAAIGWSVGRVLLSVKTRGGPDRHGSSHSRSGARTG
jgi:undecaprenyl-diphosphatase